MDDLSSLLLAAIEETERRAREATEGPWRVDYRVGAFVAAEGWAVAAGVTDIDAMHIAHNDPSSVLRRCAADRKLIERGGPFCDCDHRRTPTNPDTGQSITHHYDCSAYEAVQILAVAYGLTDHQEGEPDG